jgi:hypothetical protein
MAEKNIALRPLEVLTAEIGELDREILPRQQAIKDLYPGYNLWNLWAVPLEERQKHGPEEKRLRDEIKDLAEPRNYHKKKGWLELLNSSEIVGERHAEVLGTLSDFLAFAWDIHNNEEHSTLRYLTADAKNGIGVVLTDELHFGGPGTEYGVGVTAYRDGKKERKYFVTTPSTSWDRYHHLEFRKARILDVTDDGVSVELITSKCGSRRVLTYFI